MSNSKQLRRQSNKMPTQFLLVVNMVTQAYYEASIGTRSMIDYVVYHIIIPSPYVVMHANKIH